MRIKFFGRNEWGTEYLNLDTHAGQLLQIKTCGNSFAEQS